MEFTKLFLLNQNFISIFNSLLNIVFSLQNDFFFKLNSRDSFFISQIPFINIQSFCRHFIPTLVLLVEYYSFPMNFLSAIAHTMLLEPRSQISCVCDAVAMTTLISWTSRSVVRKGYPSDLGSYAKLISDCRKNIQMPLY